MRRISVSIVAAVAWASSASVPARAETINVSDDHGGVVPDFEARWAAAEQALAQGVLELSAGKKDIKPLGMVGILTMDQSVLALGNLGYPVQDERATVAKYSLPAGNYRPMLLNVDYGNVQVSLRADYTRAALKQSGSIEIRKDKPYVLDFAAKPEVQFQSPPKDKTFKLGEPVRLAAVLRIADKGLLIGGLRDMSKKAGEMKWMGEDGKEVTSPNYTSLDPKVVITDSAGKKVAEGTMPFG